MFTSRESCEVSQPNINANDFWRWRKWLWLNLTGKASMPVAQTISLDIQCFDPSLNGAVEFNFDVANFRKIQLSIINEPETSPSLFVSERFVPIILESWIARFLTVSHTSKEVLKSKVNSLLGFLKALRESTAEPRLVLFPLGEHLVCIIQRERFLPFLPSVMTCFESLIVDPTASIQRLLHRCLLCFRWAESILKCFSHTIIIAQLRDTVKCVSAIHLHPKG